MQSFRFVHSADIHLDSPLRGLTGQDSAAVGLIRRATGEAFTALVSRTIEEEASFLLIAGDLYDRDWQDYQTGLFFVRETARLREAGIDVYLIYGNHDAANQVRRKLALPDNVKIFPHRKPATMEVPGLGVALHGQSFGRRDVSDNLARSYPAPVSGALNIGLLHTSLAGTEGHANYAPCSLNDLVHKGYDYWALGHVHAPAVHHRRPYVVYSGVLQGRHIRETGPKGAFLVSVEDGAVAGVEAFQVDLVRWEVVSVPAEDCVAFQDLCDAIRDRVEEAVEERSDGRLLACRIELAGRTEAHHLALASEERLLAEARAAAEGLGDGRAWIERLVVRTEPPQDAADAASAADVLGDIGAAAQDEELREGLQKHIGELIRRLPHEVREGADDEMLRAAVESDYDRLVTMAGRYALARLTATGE